MKKLTAVQQQAFDRIKMIRELEQNTGITYGPVQKRVLADLSREDIIAVVDAMIEAGGSLAGYNTAALAADVAK